VCLCERHDLVPVEEDHPSVWNTGRLHAVAGVGEDLLLVDRHL
jgi:hypothetical protein